MAGLGTWLRGWLGQEHPAPVLSPPHVNPKSRRPQPFGEDNNEFALALFGLLRQRPGNVFFSPFSVRTALAMTEAGARGETAAQMREVLRIPSPEPAPHVAVAETVERLSGGGESGFELTVANSLWGQEGAPLQPEFLDRLARQYGATMSSVDFRRATEAARATMNHWIDDKTRGRIRDLIPARGLDADTRLVLMNAVYFKAKWVHQFDKTATREEPFHLDGGGKVHAPLMRQQETVRYLQADGYQAVDMAYYGGDLSMLLILPERKDGLRDIEGRLFARSLQDCVARMQPREVKLLLPRFKIASATLDLREHLEALGMRLAFTPFEADFSGMNGLVPPHEDSLFISSVFHKALVEASEAGTEAAAGTAVVAPCLMAARRPTLPPRVPTFRADHPFLFAIRDCVSGAIVLLGRLSDPTREA